MHSIFIKNQNNIWTWCKLYALQGRETHFSRNILFKKNLHNKGMEGACTNRSGLFMVVFNPCLSYYP
jgi:hypothetical protein